MAAEYRDIVYTKVDGQDLLLDLYLPEGVSPAPLVMWIHGGAWQFGSRSDVPDVFLDAGYAVASVDFRQATEAVFPAQLHDIRAAVRYLRANSADYGYRGDRIAAAGFSSGGHLASLLGTTNGKMEFDGNAGEYTQEDPSVQAVIDIAGSTNLLTILDQSTAHGLSVRVPALELLLGGSMDEPSARDLAAQASPVHQVNDYAVPILILHGVQDNQVPVNQAIELHQAYDQKGRDSQLVLIPGAEHFDDIYYQGENREIMTRFLNRVIGEPIAGLRLPVDGRRPARS